MATTAAPYQSALIQSLRAASPGFTSNNPGVTMLANPANSKTVIDFKRTPIQPYLPPGPFVGPPGPAPAPSPTPAPPPGGGGGPIVIGPGPDVGPVTPLPRIDVVPDDDFVGPMPDDFVGPMPDDFVGPMPDDFVGPPAPDDDVAQTFPVPDPAPPDAVDLPPLPPGDDDFVGPMPDDFVGPMPDDFVGPMPDDFVGPMPDDFVGPPEPPEYDEIPQGEIEVGPPGDSQPARDAINNIGDITQVDDPLGEWDWIEFDVPEISIPQIPEFDFSFSNDDLLDILFGDFGGWSGGGWGGGGGGGGGGGFKVETFQLE